jgi:tetratricopeptide (TPR) repeat protein
MASARVSADCVSAFAFPGSGSGELVGRKGDFDHIEDAIRVGGHRVILIDGQSGVGKTALAQAARTVLADRFSMTVVQSCWDEPWPSVVARSAIALAGPEPVKASSIEALEAAIIDAAARNSVLLALDNLEPKHFEHFAAFAGRWSSDPHESVLLATSITRIPISGPSVFTHHLSGLSNHLALELFGPELRERFGANTLMGHAEALGGIPLDILYVRWRSPTSLEALASTVAAVAEGAAPARMLSLETVLLELSRSPTPFMALGITRHLEFDESLLAFLTDRLSGGTAQSFVEHGASLVDRLLLTDLGNSRFRMSEQVHKHLGMVLARRLGGDERLPSVHLLASEYYRRSLDTARVPALKAMAAFVYHCIASGEVLRAYRYVFDTDVSLGRRFRATSTDLDALRQTYLEFEAATALEWREVLEWFERPAVRRQLSSAQRVHVLVELAHVASDLGEFDECVRLTHEAGGIVQGMDADASWAGEAWRRIWYYRGVASSNTGELGECVRAYLRIVETSPPGDILGCLCLGYLAHALLHIDPGAAEPYAAEAVELARTIADKTLLAKNLANHAELLTFTGQTGRACLSFEEAAGLCVDEAESTSQRELGRILKNWGVAALARAEYDLAEERLLEGIERSSAMGDRRRVASGEQYMGILRYHQGRREDAVRWLEESIGGAVTNGRYLMPALLTLARWIDPSFGGTLADLRNVSFDPNLAEIAASVADDARLEVFAKFWRDHYWPLLCTDRTEDRRT